MFMKLLPIVCVALSFTVTTIARGESFDGVMSYDGAIAATRSGKPVVITQSAGGQMAAGNRLIGHQVVIDGSCYSACAWSFARNPRACFTDNAEFGFHTLTDPTFGTPIPKANRLVLSQVRPALAQRVRGIASGGVSEVWVSAAEMHRYYPERACRH